MESGMEPAPSAREGYRIERMYGSRSFLVKTIKVLKPVAPQLLADLVLMSEAPAHPAVCTTLRRIKSLEWGHVDECREFCDGGALLAAPQTARRAVSRGPCPPLAPRLQAQPHFALALAVCVGAGDARRRVAVAQQYHWDEAGPGSAPPPLPWHIARVALRCLLGLGRGSLPRTRHGTWPIGLEACAEARGYA